MRKIACGEGWLGANMVIMVLDSIPVNQVLLMGKVCGDSFTKDGKNFIIVFPSRLVSVLLFCFGTIVGARRVLYEISSPLFMCLQ